MFNNLPEDVLVIIWKNVFQDCLDDIKDQKVFETCYGDDIEFIYKIVELDNDSLRRCFRLFMETYDLYIKELSLPVRGLTELTREGEVPVWGVKWPVVSVRPSVRPKPFPKLFPPRTCHVHAFRNNLGGINYSHETGFHDRV